MTQGQMTDKQLAGILKNAFTYKEDKMILEPGSIVHLPKGITVEEACNNLNRIFAKRRETMIDKERERIGKNKKLLLQVINYFLIIWLKIIIKIKMFQTLIF